MAIPACATSDTLPSSAIDRGSDAGMDASVDEGTQDNTLVSADPNRCRRDSSTHTTTIMLACELDDSLAQADAGEKAANRYVCGCGISSPQGTSGTYGLTVTATSCDEALEKYGMLGGACVF